MKLPSFIRSPREVPKTGDDSPATSLLTFVWRLTGWHQVVTCVAAVAVTLLNLAPIELQRRIVNEVVESQDVSMLVQIGILYIVLMLVHQVTKFCLRMYQAWLTEGAVLYVRSHLVRLYRDETDADHDNSGQAVSIINSEVEKLGGFVGQSLSQACANIAMLVGVAAYMLFVEPLIAVFALAALLPQMVLTPVMQRHLNDLVEKRVGLLRDLGDGISKIDGDSGDARLSVLPDIYTNHMKFFLLKFAMKSLLNILNSLGPITVLLFGGYLVMMGETQVGVIVAFLSGFERLSSPVRELIGFYRVAAQADVQHRMVAEWIRERNQTEAEQTAAGG